MTPQVNITCAHMMILKGTRLQHDLGALLSHSETTEADSQRWWWRLSVPAKHAGLKCWMAHDGTRWPSWSI